MSSEIWGYCDGCDRWFYCERDTAMPPRCPVCSREPVQLEERAS